MRTQRNLTCQVTFLRAVPLSQHPSTSNNPTPPVASQHEHGTSHSTPTRVRMRQFQGPGGHGQKLSIRKWIQGLDSCVFAISFAIRFWNRKVVISLVVPEMCLGEKCSSHPSKIAHNKKVPGKETSTERVVFEDDEMFAGYLLIAKKVTFIKEWWKYDFWWRPTKRSVISSEFLWLASSLIQSIAWRWERMGAHPLTWWTNPLPRNLHAFTKRNSMVVAWDLSPNWSIKNPGDQKRGRWVVFLF